MRWQDKEKISQRWYFDVIDLDTQKRFELSEHILFYYGKYYCNLDGSMVKFMFMTID